MTSQRNALPSTVLQQQYQPGHRQLRRTARRLLLAAAVAAACAPTAWSQANPPAKALPMQANAAMAGRVTTSVMPTAPCGRVEIAPVVQVSAGKSTVLRPAVPITRVLLGNPEGSRAARPAESKGKEDKEPVNGPAAQDKTRPGVAEVDVLLLSPTEVYVLGKAIGSTNVVLLDERGQCTAFDVVVNMDTTALQTVIGQLLPNETGVRVSAAFDSVVLTGTVSDAGAVIQVMDLANAYVRGAGGGAGASVVGANPRIVNMLSTGAPQQVMLEVKVAEVSKALLDRFGINFARAYVPGDGSMIRFLSGIFGGTGGLVGQISGTVGAQIGAGVVGSSTNGQSTSVFTGQLGDARIGDNPQIPFAGGKGTSTFGIDAQKNDGLVKV
ncbi:MAG: pilus assembly protein N-terminal domain-containing protein, partial [Rhizobacter sp.]|nr:pilus assembly protein N-terminal domain-containing protein [Rhizobacter sp.]